MSVDAHLLAEELAEAEREGTWVPLLSERIDDLDWQMARSVARARDDLRRAAGDAQIGYKLGWTSSAMREALGIERPNWGTVWSSQLVHGDLDPADLHHPKVEPELAAEIGSDGLPSRWCLGLEIVNPRFASYRFAWLDNTADNSSCARIVVGRWIELGDDPSAVEIEFGDGATALSGSGSNVTGGPVAAVTWLAEQLASEGTVLRNGDIVFTGGLAAPLDVRPGTTYTVSSPSHPSLGETVMRVA